MLDSIEEKLIYSLAKRIPREAGKVGKVLVPDNIGIRDLLQDGQVRGEVGRKGGVFIDIIFL